MTTPRRLKCGDLSRQPRASLGTAWYIRVTSAWTMAVLTHHFMHCHFRRPHLSTAVLFRACYHPADSIRRNLGPDESNPIPITSETSLLLIFSCTWCIGQHDYTYERHRYQGIAFHVPEFSDLPTLQPPVPSSYLGRHFSAKVRRADGKAANAVLVITTNSLYYATRGSIGYTRALALSGRRTNEPIRRVTCLSESSPKFTIRWCDWLLPPRPPRPSKATT
ncbi:hypothetical protein F4782DRAFT_521808 [Xylaria castorea]|nr:hypothetical protein F4782DRAFT_521808 [Xylaria castorea]